MKSAKEYWKEQFDEYPQNNQDKLAVAMMARYGEYIKGSICHRVKQCVNTFPGGVKCPKDVICPFSNCPSP